MKITFAIFLVAFLKASNQQCLSANESIPPNIHGRSALYTGQEGFALDLLRAVNQLMPNENLFFSPYSIYHALLIAYFLVGGQGESELKNGLRLEPSLTKTDFYNAYKLDKLQTRYENNQNNSYEFTSANKIYVADDINVRQCVTSTFSEEMSKVPFKNDPQGARNTINNWIEEHTHHLIKDLLPPGTVDQNATLYLVNAAYFKGKWEHKFNSSETRRESFYVSLSKRIKVDMMKVEGTFNHDVSASLEAHILEMPYEGHISMYIFLPPFSKKDGIDNILKKLTVGKFLGLVQNSHLTAKTVQVSLPRFSLEHTIELVPVLKKLGFLDLFQSENWSTLSEDKVSLKNTLHKAKIEVDENGTETPAASVLLSSRSGVSAKPVQFHCNHPFIYILYDKAKQAILFAGVFR